MQLGKWVMGAAIVGLLAGCGHVPLTSIPALARIDMVTTELDSLHAAVRLPDSVELDPDGLVMTVTLATEVDGEEQHEYVLTHETDPALLAELSSEASEGSFVRVFSMPEAAQIQMAELRDRIKDYKVRGIKGRMDISISPKKLCRKPGEGEKRVKFDSFLKTSETGRFVATARGVAIDELADKLKGASVVPVCGAQKPML